MLLQKFPLKIKKESLTKICAIRGLMWSDLSVFSDQVACLTVIGFISIQALGYYLYSFLNPGIFRDVPTGTAGRFWTAISCNEHVATPHTSGRHSWKARTPTVSLLLLLLPFSFISIAPTHYRRLPLPNAVPVGVGAAYFALCTRSRVPCTYHESKLSHILTDGIQKQYAGTRTHNEPKNIWTVRFDAGHIIPETRKQCSLIYSLLIVHIIISSYSVCCENVYNFINL